VSLFSLSNEVPVDSLLLTQNSHIPAFLGQILAAAHRVPEGHGLQGMLAIAEMLCKAGAGYPILHDITSCLRVGDITFYTPDSDPLTVEVKTRLKGYQSDHRVLEVAVYCVSTPSEDTRWNAILAQMPQEIVVPEDMSVNDQMIQEPQAMEEGLQRQMERMAEIAARQTAQDGEPLRLGERNVYIVQHLTSEQSMHHYDILQELTRDAKAQGFAWRTVDDAFVYTAVYRDTPLWLQEGEQIIPEQRVEDYQRANISIAFPAAAKNFACIYDVFNSPPFVRPFFLYPLPVDIVMDMMWKRPQIIVTINLGKLVAALQAVGVNARLPTNKQESAKLFLPVSLEIPLPDGRKAYGRLRNLQYYGAQITHEFLSLQGFAKLITSTVEVTAEQVIKEGVFDNFYDVESY
jgi:hypothetical protein